MKQLYRKRREYLNDWVRENYSEKTRREIDKKIESTNENVIKNKDRSKILCSHQWQSECNGQWMTIQSVAIILFTQYFFCIKYLCFNFLSFSNIKKKTVTNTTNEFLKQLTMFIAALEQLSPLRQPCLSVLINLHRNQRLLSPFCYQQQTQIKHKTKKVTIKWAAG